MKRIVPAIAAAALAVSAFGQGQINDGNALFRLNSSTTHGSSDFRPEGGTSTDHWFQNWWWYRVEGDTRETNFTWPPTNQNYTGNTATLGGADASGRFNWELTIVLTDGGSAGQASLAQTMRVTNLTNQALNLAVFSYLDADVGGTAGTDSAQLVGNMDMEIRDGNNFVRYQGPGADAYQVTSFATLRGGLTDSDIDNFNNSGLPFGPGDFTGGYQWNRVVEPGQSLVINQNSFVNIPEPATLTLLALGALTTLRRRR